MSIEATKTVVPFFSHLTQKEAEHDWNFCKEHPDLSHFVPQDLNIRPQAGLRKLRIHLLYLPTPPLLDQRIQSHVLRELSLDFIAKTRKEVDVVTVLQRIFPSNKPSFPIESDFESHIRPWLETNKELLKDVSKLDLSQTLISTFDERLIPYLPQVEIIDFSSNIVSAFYPFKIFLNLLDFPNLKTLILSSNFLVPQEIEKIREIGDTKSIKILVLG